jgi:hypothetical protein
MFRIDTPTAVAVLPAEGAPGAPGFFTNGDPNAPTPATIVDQGWFNRVQEEIAYVIEQNGIVLDKANHHQLYAAIAAMVGGGIAGLATEAWVNAHFDPLGAAAAAQAAAIANAHAYTDAQIAAIPHPVAAYMEVNSGGGGGTVAPSVSFTPAGPGVLLAFGSRVNSAADTAPGHCEIDINAVNVTSDSSTLSISHMWAGTTAGGASVTAAYGATATVQFTARILLVFIPNP